jgi:hypothetical protein
MVPSARLPRGLLPVAPGFCHGRERHVQRRLWPGPIEFGYFLTPSADYVHAYLQELNLLIGWDLAS